MAVESRRAADTADDRSAWHLFVARHAQRDRLARAQASRGIATHAYPKLPHLQGAFASSFTAARGLEASEGWGREVLSLPIGSTMDDAAVDAVIGDVRAALAELA